MITITRDLPLISFAGNPMKIAVSTDNMYDETTGYAVLREFYTLFLEIFTEDPSGEGVEPIWTESVEPDEDGYATIDISRIIKNLLITTMLYPDSLGTHYFRDTGAVKEFWVKLGDGYGVPFERQAMQTEEGPYYAIPGGLADWLLDNIEDVDGDSYTFLEQNKIFLTNQPDNKRVKPMQPEYLRWMNISETAVSVLLKVKQYTLIADGATSTIKSVSLPALSMNNFNVTPGDAFTLAADTVRWEIWLEASSVVISEVVTYRRDEQREPRTRYFIFQNSLGGFDTVAATGKRAKGIEGESALNYMPLSTNLRSALQINQDRPMCKEVYKGFIGLFSEAEAEWLQEFFRSEKRYLIGENRLENVGLKAIDYVMTNDDPVPQEVPIEAYVGVPDFFFLTGV